MRGQAERQSGMLIGVTPTALQQLKAAAFAQLRPVTQPDGVHQRWGALLAVGAKPRQ